MTWTALTVLDVVQETPCDRTFVLAPDAAAASRFRFEPGQYLRLRDPDERPERDWYFSLSGAPRDDGTLRVTIRGRGERVQRMYDAAVGKRWVAEPPTGTFRIHAEPGETLVLVAAGSGVTPFHAYLEQYRQRESRDPIWLLHSARAAEELIFRSDFIAWADEVPTIHYEPRLTAPDPSWDGHRGRIGPATLAPALVQPATTRVYASGPEGFVDRVLDHARLFGVAPEHCLRETW